MNPETFVQKWAITTLNERQTAQSHFNDLCDLIGQPHPTDDAEGVHFAFEKRVLRIDGSQGSADVWREGRFVWEYKTRGADLNAAYQQALTYRGALHNPPLVVVSDIARIRIYPQYPGLSDAPFELLNADLLDPERRRWLDWVFEEPERFAEMRRRQEEQRERLTERLARQFADLARIIEAHNQQGWSAERIARFLTRILFVLFAEDAGLLPLVAAQMPLFRYLLTASLEDVEQGNHDAFPIMMRPLFRAMNGQESLLMGRRVPYFNGGLFAPTPDEGDNAEVLDISQIPGVLKTLIEVSDADWQQISPTIFGTLFERALDPGKRAQLGAHYTGESDIRLVLEPVLMTPLRREWETVRARTQPLLEQYEHSDTPPRERLALETELRAAYSAMRDRLRATTVLDPACGSGNFLYLSLRLLKDLERQVRDYFRPLELPFEDIVTPRQIYGIEKDAFAAKLAQVSVWIGYLQWRKQTEGVLIPMRHGRPNPPNALTEPILQDKNHPDEPDHIQQADAVLRYAADGTAYEPEWPPATVIVGNPPFLGGNRVRAELGSYVDDLFRLYEGRVPAFADLVTYWFEKARAHVEAGRAERAGLLATNSIRGGANREVLARIKASGDIFMAWADREWVLNGAAVRISVVGFDNGAETVRLLDGEPTEAIHSDLTGAVDVASAARLQSNFNLVFMGVTPAGKFDLTDAEALRMLASPNPTGVSNADVVKCYIIAEDLVQSSRRRWTVDFGTSRSVQEAARYELPFAYVTEHVRPTREANKRASYREKWWLYAEPRPAMRQALNGLPRYLATPMVAKHRVFVWLDQDCVPSNLINVFARSDDYFFGVLHSTVHECWSLRMGTSLEDRPRYTPTTTFETFPLPYAPGAEPTAAPEYAAIAAAAAALHAERDAWLHPVDFAAGTSKPGRALRDYTLTNLYNALADVRAGKPLREGVAKTFAPRLAELHAALDVAVLAAYGWGDLAGQLRTPTGEAALLARLLALNTARAAAMK